MHGWSWMVLDLESELEGGVYSEVVRYLSRQILLIRFCCFANSLACSLLVFALLQVPSPISWTGHDHVHSIFLYLFLYIPLFLYLYFHLYLYLFLFLHLFLFLFLFLYLYLYLEH